MVLPAVRFLRQKYPSAYMCVVWFDGGLPVVDAEFNEVLTFPPNSTLQKLRVARLGYDLCFVSTLGVHNVLTEVCSLISGASVRIGPVFGHVNPKGSIYNRPYILDGRKHETVLNAIGAGWSGSEEVLPYPIRLTTFPARDSTGNRTRLGLHVGCKQGYEMKRWPPDHYHALIQVLSQDNLFDFVLLGDHTEAPLMEEVARDCANATVEVLSSLDQFMTQIKACDVFIGNDSGLCHLAAALEVPTVVVMGPTDPKLCRPVFSQGRVLQVPCVENFCFYSGAVCKHCLDAIPAAAAAEAIMALCSARQEDDVFAAAV